MKESDVRRGAFAMPLTTRPLRSARSGFYNREFLSTTPRPETAPGTPVACQQSARCRRTGAPPARPSSFLYGDVSRGPNGEALGLHILGNVVVSVRRAEHHSLGFGVGCSCRDHAHVLGTFAPMFRIVEDEAAAWASLFYHIAAGGWHSGSEICAPWLFLEGWPRRADNQEHRLGAAIIKTIRKPNVTRRAGRELRQIQW